MTHSKKNLLFSVVFQVVALTAVLQAGAQDDAAKNGLTKRPLRDYGLKEYIYLSKQLPHSESKAWRLVCQMPYNCQFQPWIQLKAREGKTIALNSSNPLVLYLTKTENYLTHSGDQHYEAKRWISGEGAIYTIPPGVTVESVKYRETGYDTKFAGSFECNDNDYNVLWKKGARTAYLCMRDHFYDCPDRERVGFWGDGTPELDQCFYAFDTASHALCKELVRRPLEAGFYPGQQLEFLGKYGLWFYYMQTGDLESIRLVYDSTKNFLFNTYQFGHRNQWFDWGKEIKDIAVTERCFMYIDLKSLKEMALLTGHDADTLTINAKLDSIKSAFNSSYWKGGYYMSAQVSTPDDRANAMAINAGLAESSKWEAIYNNVLTRYQNASCFFDRWVFEALCKMGKQEYALLRMYSRYRTMISCSFTSLWEHYDRWWASHINAFDQGSSLNHGWNPPVLLLSQTIAGVSPEEAGWKTYHVFPKEAFLKSIKVVVPSVKGNIQVSLHKTATEYRLTLTSPQHTRAIVGIPKSAFSALKSVSVNGISIWEGSYTGGVNGISWAGEDADYIKFNAIPGIWNFAGTGTLINISPKPASTVKPAGKKLDKKYWTASASVKDGIFLFNDDSISIAAANALDEDHWTGWRDLTARQHPLQWFMVDMKKQQKFNQVVLDNTWALWDSPNRYSVSVSNDGQKWNKQVASGSGTPGITRIRFPETNARYIKIAQTGTDTTYNWSIYEMDVYRGSNN